MGSPSSRTCYSHLGTWDVDRFTVWATPSPLSRWLINVHAFRSLTCDLLLIWFELVTHVTTNFLWFVVNQFSLDMMWTTVLYPPLTVLDWNWIRPFDVWKLNSSKVETLYQAGLLGTRFLPWTNKDSTCRKALFLVPLNLSCIIGRY